MEAWLKGGLIGAGIWIVVIVLFFLSIFPFLYRIIFSIPEWIVGRIIGCIGDPGCFGIALFVGLVFYFLVGALIGWIIGRIKRK